MRFLRLLSACVLALLSAIAADAAELRVPESFDVLSVNDQPFGMTLKSLKQIPLQQGRNVVVLEYDQIFDASFGDSHDRIRSAPFALIISVDADTVLTLQQPSLSDGSAAQAYAKAPVLQLLDAQQQPFPHQLQRISEHGIEHQGKLAAALAPATDSAAARAAGLAAPAEVATMAKPSQVQMPAAPAAIADEAADALQMLSYWWQQATPEQRAAFLQQIVR